MSELKNHFYKDLKKIQEQLYDDCVTQGWFARRPDRVRLHWTLLGALLSTVGLGVAILLAVTTHLGLLGMPLALLGFAFIVLPRWMPSRTRKGSSQLKHTLAFRQYIATAEADRMQFAEEEHIFAKYLPYAIVFGETKRWAKAFAGLDEATQLGWYAGVGPFNAGHFSDSMSRFTVSTAGAIASTPGSSGFGGSSGGGGGGGGGGSW